MQKTSASIALATTLLFLQVLADPVLHNYAMEGMAGQLVDPIEPQEMYTGLLHGESTEVKSLSLNQQFDLMLDYVPLKSTQQYNEDPIPYEGDVVSEVLSANKFIDSQLTFTKNDLFNPPVPCDDYNSVLGLNQTWNPDVCQMSQTLPNGDMVSLSLVLERGILDRLLIEKTVKEEKTTTTKDMSNYNLKVDSMLCKSVPNLDSIALLVDKDKSHLSVFVWIYDETNILFKIRTVVGDTVKGLLSNPSVTSVCKLKGKQDVWFSSPGAESEASGKRSTRKNVLLDFSNSYLRVKAVTALRVNQRVTGTSKLMMVANDGEQTFKSLSYQIISKADPNKLLYFLQKSMSITQSQSKKQQEFPLDAHFSFLGNGINLAAQYQVNDNVSGLKSLSLYTWEGTPFKQNAANRVFKSKYQAKTVFIKETYDSSELKYLSEFSISNFDKGEPVFILESSVKTSQVGFITKGIDTCIVGIVDPNVITGKEPFSNLFFVHKGESEKKLTKKNLDNKVVTSLKVLESPFALQLPYFLALTTANELRMVNFNCDATELKLTDLGLLVSDVSGFDYLAMKVSNKPYLFVFYSTSQKMELKIAAFEIDESTQPTKFILKDFNYQQLIDDFKLDIFDDLRNYRYLRVIHHPNEDNSNSVDIIVDGNDAKVFLLSGIFSVNLNADTLFLKFTNNLQTKFRKSSISRVSFCDSTKNYVICQQLMPDPGEIKNPGIYTNNNLAVLVFPKENTNPIKDLQTDTIYSKSVVDLNYGAKMQVLNNLFVTYDYDGDQIAHLTETGENFDILQLDSEFKLVVKDSSDVSNLGLEVYPLITQDEQSDKVVLNPQEFISNYIGLMKGNGNVFLIIAGSVVLISIVLISIKISSDSKIKKVDPRLNQYGDMFSPSIDQTGGFDQSQDTKAQLDNGGDL